MKLEDAYRAAIKAYFKGKQPENSMQASAKRIKYTKKYFDAFEEEEFGSKTGLKKSEDKPSKPKKRGS